MTIEDYISQAKRYAEEYERGDSSGIELLARIACEAEEAKQKLRAAGIGYTGMSLLRSVEEVIGLYDIRKSYK